MQRLSHGFIRSFQQKVLTWYAANKRDLPWREIPGGISLEERAYRVLVSEVMLQQTQVARVIPKYEAWLVALPTLTSLAHATTAEVLRLWSGLGYNRRALYLKRAAEILTKKVEEVEGVDASQVEKGEEFPRTEEELRKLPGIGEYTARAILCFAFDQQIAVVDTNVRKVVLLHFGNRHPGKRGTSASRITYRGNERDSGVLPLVVPRMTDKDIQHIADALLPFERAYEWNQALMDYAASELQDQKVPTPKQSPFKGSNRYYRGQIVKTLLTKKHMTLAALSLSLKKEQGALTPILQGLVRDGLLEEKNGRFFLAT